jgi:hypothetical protein
MAPLPAQADEPVTENMYLSGQEVRPDGPVTGDLVAAAGRITVDHAVHGDAVLGAGSIEIRGAVDEDLRIAGGVITLSNRVGGDAMIAGGNIAFGPNVDIHGPARIAGYDTAIAGRFRRGLTVYARHILVFAHVDGDVRLVGDTIELLPAANIGGRLTYVSNNPINVHPGARVGNVVREPGTFPRLELPGWRPFPALLLLGLLAAGALLLSLFPRFTDSAVRTMGSAPVKSLGLGTALFFSMPPVILLLVITIIGIPIALAGAALYAIALLAGYLVGAYCIGGALLRAARHAPAAGRGLRIGALAAALILLWAVRQVPYAGTAIVLLVLVAGLGAMALQAFSTYARPGQPTPTS